MAYSRGAVRAAAQPTATRGRPPNSAAVQQRRCEIIAAAHEVFADKGHHAAGVADFAARLDNGHGTFYRCVDNRRDILDHVVDHGVTRFLTEVAPDDHGEANDREQLGDHLTTVGTRRFTEVVDAAARALTACVIAGLLVLVRRPMTAAERSNCVDTLVSMICDNTNPSSRGRRS